MTILFNNINSDQTSTEEYVGTGGPAIAFVRADNYGGGTVSLEITSPNDPGQRPSIINNGSFDSNGEVQIDYLPSGSKIKSTLVGSSGAINVFVEVI